MTDPVLRSALEALRDQKGDIAAQMLAEMVSAAQMESVPFDDEQSSFVEQALLDAVQETLNRAALLTAWPAPQLQEKEEEAKSDPRDPRTGARS